VQEANALWSAVLALAPCHLAALTQVGQAAWNRGDLAAAAQAFDTAAQVEPANPRRWVNLAMVQERGGDEAGLAASIARALALEPRELMALLMRGRQHERAGRAAAAAADFGAAVAVSPPIDQLLPEHRPALAHAIDYGERHRAALASHLDQRLAQGLRDIGGAGAERFRLSLDILLGRKRRQDPQPLIYYYPNLAPVEFFDRAAVPWLDAMEAGADAVRAELLAVLAADSGFEPYLQYAEGQPLDQWAGLNQNPAWSAFHLVQRGAPVDANASRCPQTMALWQAHVPAPQQSGRTPVAMFSLLRPRTRIPPHTGASNVRLVNHLALIVPADCRFRVGNSVREWVAGKAWAFDDTIEHEAWNDSDALRAVMIFDTWHPALSLEERQLIEQLNAALDEFGASEAYAA
jgi:aspartate beta-hydroxylase